MPKKVVAGDKNRFDDLPDDLLRRILYFLPGDDAMQTCVLDTRWREIWRRTTRLSFVYDGWSFPTCERFHQLVKLIIQLRENSPLTYCQINPFTDDVENCIRFARTRFTRTEQLMEYVLECRVEQLVVCPGDNYHDKTLSLQYGLISRYLRTIDFELVDFEGSSLDFSDCPALEELTMRGCNFYVCRIVSESLKHLQLIEFCSFPEDYRIQIYAPRLISLRLGSLDGIAFDGFRGLTPLLEKMPLLETAFVTIAGMCSDSCGSKREDFNDPSCTCCDDNCVLLNGLSNAVHLKLTAQPKMFIYRWDLAWCPIFGKLKTLVLNEWFTATDLVCILQHSPVLKKLTLQFDNTENFVGATISQKTIEQPIVCACLLVVEIGCREVDQGVRKILKILSICGIHDKQISIKNRRWHWDSMMFL
uniref:Uncharacterized protein n=1 Tax=Avena sativa TaxID=4498 RepID=A0ACD5ZEG5_AVESA